MEIVKGTIQGKRVVELNGQKMYKHVLCAVILTDEPNRFIDSNIDIIMGESSIMDGISQTKRYIAPQHIAGADAVGQLLGIGDCFPDDLEEIIGDKNANI